jgi:hypothetical protein
MSTPKHVFRKVEVQIKLPVDGAPDKWAVTTRAAIFHRWGSRYSKAPNPTGNCETVGIVELDNGRIRMVSPEKVRFLEGEWNLKESRAVAP